MTALRGKNAKSFSVVTEFMLATRAVAVGFTLITVAKTMTSVAATTSTEPRGLHASASRDARSGSPRQRLQKLLAVPGYAPNRVNDLLLLRPETDGQTASGPKEKSSNKHVVFFHGDIQVSVTEVVGALLLREGSHVIHGVNRKTVTGLAELKVVT